MSFVNRVIDFLASEDVIDLYFILSDLVDIPISEAEACETAHYDSMATYVAANVSCDSGTSIGKMVC